MQLPADNLNLFLTALGEPAENMLRIAVAEGVVGRLTKIDWDGQSLGEPRPIEVTDESRLYEITWDNYVAYVVRNESFWKEEPGEPPFEGHLSQRYKTAFMRYISETTFADNEYPGPLEQWSLTTLTHCVDVVSVGPPRVVSIGSKA